MVAHLSSSHSEAKCASKRRLVSLPTWCTLCPLDMPPLAPALAPVPRARRCSASAAAAGRLLVGVNEREGEGCGRRGWMGVVGEGVGGGWVRGRLLNRGERERERGRGCVCEKGER